MSGVPAQRNPLLHSITPQRIWSEHAAEVSLSLQGGCCLWWISVVDAYCNSHACIAPGNVSNLQAPGRGDFAKYTHCSRSGEVGVCVSYCSLLEQGGGHWFCNSAALLAGSRGDQARLPGHLHAGVNSHMEWSKWRCDLLTSFSYVRVNSWVKLRVPTFPWCLLLSFR